MTEQKVKAPLDLCSHLWAGGHINPAVNFSRVLLFEPNMSNESRDYLSFHASGSAWAGLTGYIAGASRWHGVFI